MNNGLASAAQQIASYGRGKDTMLAHITPSEASFIDAIQGGRRTNPQTGLPEYGLFGKVLKAAVRIGATVGGFVLSGGNPLAAAAASGAATKLTGGSWKQAATSAALTGATAGIGNIATGPSLWSNEALKQGAASAAPGILTKEIGGVGTGQLLTQEAAKQAAKQTALGSLYQGIGGATGVGVGLTALTGAPLSKTDEAPPPPDASGFGGNINLNVAPLNRQYVPITDPGSSRGHKFFDRVNPAPVYLEPADKQAALEDEFLARGGRAGKRISRAAARGRIAGPGTGTSDSIPAMLSDGEHVWDEATVTLAGNGNNAKGHAVLEKMKQRVRARAGMTKPSKPPAFGGA